MRRIPIHAGGTKSERGRLIGHALGTFDTEEEAAEAARRGRERLLPYSMEVIPSR